MHVFQSTASRNKARALDAAYSLETGGSCPSVAELEIRRLPSPLEPRT